MRGGLKGLALLCVGSESIWHSGVMESLDYLNANSDEGGAGGPPAKSPLMVSGGAIQNPVTALLVGKGALPGQLKQIRFIKIQVYTNAE